MTTYLQARLVIGERETGSSGALGGRIAMALVIVCFAYVLFLPVSHNRILYSAFLAIGAVSFVSIIRQRRTFAAEVLLLAFLVAALAGYGIAIGTSNPGLVYTLLIWVAAPGLYFLCTVAATPQAIKYFFYAAVAATLAVSALLLVFVSGEAGVIPQLVPIWLENQIGLGATFSGGESQARSYNLSSLSALGPLWAGSLVVRRDVLLPAWSTRLVCAVAAFAAALVSSRSAIVIVIVVAPFIALALRALLGKRPITPIRLPARAASWILATGALGAFAVAAFVPRLQTFGPLVTAFQSVSSFFTGRAATSNTDQSIRSDEADHLLQAWTQNPLFGSGFGARVPDYARTSERPWALELQYHLLLFNVGLVGALFVIAILVVATVFLRRAVRQGTEFTPSMVVAVTTAIAMLIANATNPYLQAPGHMWAIFLPLALANAVVRPKAKLTARWL